MYIQKQSILLFFLVLVTGFSALAQQYTFSNIGQQMVYFDTQSTLLAPIANSEKVNFPVGSSFYFACCDGNLVFGSSQEELQCPGTPAPMGNHSYTVSLPAPADGAENSNTLSLFMTYVKMNEEGGYVLLQFSTLTMTDLDDANSLKMQSNHIQIAEGQIFRIEYENGGPECPNVYQKLTTTW